MIFRKFIPFNFGRQGEGGGFSVEGWCHFRRDYEENTITLTTLISEQIRFF